MAQQLNMPFKNDFEKLDFTWRNPSPAQEAALKMVVERRGTMQKLTEFEAAEFVCMAETSLWYSQAKQWIDSPPNIGPAGRIWVEACRIIVDVVGLGFDDETGIWWNVSGKREEEMFAEFLVLADFGCMLAQYRRQSTAVVSTGFEVFLGLYLGKGWEKKYEAVLQKMANSDKALLNRMAPVFGLKPPYPEPREKISPFVSCINPFCDHGPGGRPNLVDSSKRKSGACCRECMNYECTHPDCVLKAKVNGWGRYTHRWGTKIAEAHQEWRKK